MQQFLQGLHYPASKQDIVHKAEQNGADENITSKLQKLPDRAFSTQDELKNVLSKIIK
jgi:hypothetical protein